MTSSGMFRVNSEMECARKWPWSKLRYYPGSCLDTLRKSNQYLSGLQFLSCDMSPGTHIYEAGIQFTHLWR